MGLGPATERLPLGSHYADLQNTVSHADAKFRGWWDICCDGSGSAGKPWCYSLVAQIPDPRPQGVAVFWKWVQLLCWLVWQLKYLSQGRWSLHWALDRLGTSSLLLSLNSHSINCPTLVECRAQIKHHKAQNPQQRWADKIKFPWFQGPASKKVASGSPSHSTGWKWRISGDLPLLLPDSHSSFLFQSGVSGDWNSPRDFRGSQIKPGEWAVEVMILQQQQMISSRDKSKKIGRYALRHSKRL